MHPVTCATGLAVHCQAPPSPPAGNVQLASTFTTQCPSFFRMALASFCLPGVHGAQAPLQGWGWRTCLCVLADGVVVGDAGQGLRAQHLGLRPRPGLGRHGRPLAARLLQGHTLGQGRWTQEGGQAGRRAGRQEAERVLYLYGKQELTNLTNCVATRRWVTHHTAGPGNTVWQTANQRTSDNCPTNLRSEPHTCPLTAGPRMLALDR